MLILRRLTKLFARRDVFPEELKKRYKFNKDLAISCDETIIDVTISDEFKNQFNQSTNTNRTIIEKFKKELKTKPITWFEDGGNNSADTHYLKDYSSKSKSYVMFSKKINNADRLNYRVYEPIITKDETTGKRTYYQKIVLDTCLDHSINGKSGSYVKGQTGTVWHSPKKSRKRNKLKKDDLE